MAPNLVKSSNLAQHPNWMNIKLEPYIVRSWNFQDWLCTKTISLRKKLSRFERYHLLSLSHYVLEFPSLFYTTCYETLLCKSGRFPTPLVDHMTGVNTVYPITGTFRPSRAVSMWNLEVHLDHFSIKGLNTNFIGDTKE